MSNILGRLSPTNRLKFVVCRVNFENYNLIRFTIIKTARSEHERFYFYKIKHLTYFDEDKNSLIIYNERKKNLFKQQQFWNSVLSNRSDESMPWGGCEGPI